MTSRAACVLVLCCGCDVVLHLDPIDPLRDASSRVDGPRDSSIDAMPTYCITSAPAGTVFCADFDQPATGLTQFSPIVTGASGLAEYSGDATSSPDSLQATLPTDTMSDTAYAAKAPMLAQYNGSIIFDAKLLTLASCTPNVVELQFMGPGGAIPIGVTSTTNSYQLYSGSASCVGGPYDLGADPTQWNHLALVVDTGQGTVMLTNGQLSVILTCTALTQTTTLGMVKIGAYANSGHAMCSMLFDDVVITSG